MLKNIVSWPWLVATILSLLNTLQGWKTIEGWKLCLMFQGQQKVGGSRVTMSSKCVPSCIFLRLGVLSFLWFAFKRDGMHS